jgi:phosphoribosylformylglycinamidine cyclo-ligase
MPPIFRFLQAQGGVPEAELYQVFNMGVGMVTIVAAREAGAILKFIRGHGHKAWAIGEVTRGTGEARVV